MCVAIMTIAVTGCCWDMYDHTTTTFAIPTATQKLQELSMLIKSHLSTLHCCPPSFKKLKNSPAIHLSPTCSSLCLHVAPTDHH